MASDPAYILGLDIGNVRIGLAKSLWPGGIPSPYKTIKNDDAFMTNLIDIVNEEKIVMLVVGQPRNLSGDDTRQTESVRDLVEIIKTHIAIPVYYQDEALTSVKAKKELNDRKKPYNKEDIDSLSATYILEDFMNGYEQGVGFEIQLN